MTISLPDERPFAARMKPAHKWLMWLGITASADVVSYVWLDRPIARWAHEHLHQYDLFAKARGDPRRARRSLRFVPGHDRMVA